MESFPVVMKHSLTKIMNVDDYMADHEEVLSVFPTPILKLQTTRSWDYLESRSGDILSAGRHHLSAPQGKDVIIGVIDSGIWPDSPSFSDEGIGEIPSRWKGVCMEADDFKKSACNRKLIGARYYTNDPKSNGSNNGSPRDQNGHGTHTASTAGGALVPNANYKGLAKGTARGGFPSSRLAVYKACPGKGAQCDGSFILKALDDAVHDGVDIVSLSIGTPAGNDNTDFFTDPIAVGSFAATIDKGIIVIAAGGNDGPRPYTISNTAPWLFTVAASTLDRNFVSSIVLGNGDVVQGYSIHFSKLKRSGAYPLAFGGDVAISSSSSTMDARICKAESLDKKKVEGKILVCHFTGANDPIDVLFESAKPRGIIYVNNSFKVFPVVTGDIPFAGVDNVVGTQILKYIKSTKNPKATILPTVEINKVKPTPIVADFSSRGPGLLTEAILKPDITAPGVGILASMPPKDLALDKPTEFRFDSGTSMATPHVSGAAAYIKSVRPDWTPSIIKSALMTTATMSNNLGQPITNSSDAFSDLHEIGAGEISPTRALNPGLAYETTLKDYLKFFCYYGYSEKFIGQLVDKKIHCPRKSSKDLISDINYPSISISKLQGSRTIMRTVTNVGPKKSTYIAKINSPIGLEVQVSPKKLVFTEGSTKASFKVSFTKKGAAKGYKFGSIIWSDGMHFVRSVFAVNVV